MLRILLILNQFKIKVIWIRIHLKMLCNFFKRAINNTFDNIISELGRLITKTV